MNVKRRGYRQFCGLARTLDVIGERWTLLIVRELLLGPKRYRELLEELPGLTTNLLAKRLRDMESAGLIEPSRERGLKLWALTESGRALEPALMELGRWGARLLDKPRRGDRVDTAWLLIALKRRFRGTLGDEVFGLVIHEARGTRRFELSGSGSYLHVRERTPHRPVAVVEGDGDAFRALWLTGADLEDLIAAQRLRVDGEPRAFARLLAAFTRDAASSFVPPP